MPPTLALSLWLILLLALFYFDPARDPEASWASWVPLVWLFFVGSRSPSIWLGLVHRGNTINALEEGNPMDRAISSLLILLTIGILFARRFRWGDFFARNSALVAFLSFGLLSVIWSDFPFITFKKWFRDLGMYLVILVVLSDPRPLEAVRTVLRRLCYLLIPLSIVLIKYTALGKTYSVWSGAAEVVGAATDKNMLGVLCLVSGIFFFWDTLSRWPERKERQTKRIILVNLAFLGMTSWLMNLAQSATSGVCLALGCLVIAVAHSKAGKRRPGLLTVLAPGIFLLYLILAVGFGMSGSLAEAVGRNPTLSDRTNFWRVLLSMQTHPLVGFGYQSFWLGSRIAEFWRRLGNGDNVHETHNGYLGIYLDLGAIGFCLFCLFLISSYRTICKKLKPFTGFGSLSLALWTMLLFYNVTEQSFEGGLLYLTFLLSAIVIPECLEERAHDIRSPDVGVACAFRQALEASKEGRKIPNGSVWQGSQDKRKADPSRLSRWRGIPISRGS
jgi:exopolysaccharide production protein ExoQ